MIIDCISDMHGNFPDLEGGDLLIIAGDMLSGEGIELVIDFNNWVSFISDKYKKVIIIAGNHDNFLNDQHETVDFGYMTYLCDSGIEFEGLKIWGSPWTKTFPGINPKCKAFTCISEEHLKEKWDLIPLDTNIIITHCPPAGILDENYQEISCGSYTLLHEIKRIMPKLHAFGHVHEQGGKREEHSDRHGRKTIFVNASIMNYDYKPKNQTIRIEL